MEDANGDGRHGSSLSGADRDSMSVHAADDTSALPAEKRDRLRRGSEGFARLDRHVIVKTSSEVIELADRPSVVASASGARDAAFVRLADEHLDKAYRLARAILRDPVEAQDATHDAFVQAWRKWGTLRDPERFEPWFDRILVNTCRDRLRAAQPAGDGHLGRGRRRVRRPVRSVPRPGRPGRRHRRAVGRPPGRGGVALLPGSDHRRHREPARHPCRDRPVAPALRAQAAPPGDRCRPSEGTLR